MTCSAATEGWLWVTIVLPRSGNEPAWARITREGHEPRGIALVGILGCNNLWSHRSRRGTPPRRSGPRWRFTDCGRLLAGGAPVTVQNVCTALWRCLGSAARSGLQSPSAWLIDFLRRRPRPGCPDVGEFVACRGCSHGQACSARGGTAAVFSISLGLERPRPRGNLRAGIPRAGRHRPPARDRAHPAGSRSSPRFARHATGPIRPRQRAIRALRQSPARRDRPR